MGRPGYNPPNLECPECVEPSKVFHLGSKINSEGNTQHRWACANKHYWLEINGRKTLIHNPVQNDGGNKDREVR